MTAMLEIQNLCVNYGRLAAVRDVSLSVNKSEIVCIVGPNGAGKSTSMLAIAGALSARRGTIRFDGSSLDGVPADDIVRRGISLVPEGRHIFASLTVEENLRLATFVRKDRDRVIEADLQSTVEKFPALGDRLSYPAGRLSGGEQQQLAIARALLTNPTLLLVDEPSLGLAPMIVDLVYENLRDLRENGLTLLIVEQSFERSLEVADRLYVLRNGVVQLTGTREELQDGVKVEEAYFGFARDRGSPS